MWKTGISNEDVARLLDKASAEDCNFADGRVLASMCTEPLDMAKQAHLQFIGSNLGNSGLYPGTRRLEKDVIGAIADLFHGHDLAGSIVSGRPAVSTVGERIAGSIVSGGTEANITALWVARNITRKKKVIFPRSGHFSFLKACDLLALEPVVISLTDDFTIDLDHVARVVDDDVCAIIGIAGTTELGMVDDIPGLAQICPDGTFLHVDAAFGGFVLPFLEPLGVKVPAFDFSIPEVSTLTVDPHKMGMATVPSGALLLRNGDWMAGIDKEAPYLSTVGQTAALSGTRCSAAVAATYAAMRTLGRDGYLKIVEGCMDVTRYALEKARKLGLEPVVEPLLNILCLYVPDVKTIQKTLDGRGWKVSVSKNPEGLRLVIMPHVTRESIDALFTELEDILGRL